MKNANSLEVTNPVRTRVTFNGDGGGLGVRLVHCRQRGCSVPLGMCHACPDALALPVHPADRDAEVRCRIEGSASPYLADFAESAVRATVGEIMRRRVACVRAEASWEALEELLIDEDAGAVPVVDAETKPIGIVTKADLLRRRRDSGGDEAREFMTPVVHALSERAPVSFALAALATAEVTHIPVVADSNEVVGLISARDALRWVAQKLHYVVPPPGA